MISNIKKLQKKEGKDNKSDYNYLDDTKTTQDESKLRVTSMPGNKGSATDQITNLNRALQMNEDSKNEAKKLYDKH